MPQNSNNATPKSNGNPTDQRSHTGGKTNQTSTNRPSTPAKPAIVSTNANIESKMDKLFNEFMAVKDELVQVGNCVTTLTDTIANLTAELSQLKQDNINKDKRIVELEAKVDMLEQNTRMNDLVITGFDAGPKTYAQTAASNSGDNDQSDQFTRFDRDELENKVVSFLTENGVPISGDAISACYSFKKRPGSDGPDPIIIQLVNRKVKQTILKNAKNLKKSDQKGVFINEHLTPRNANLAYKARQLTKSGAISATWVSNCKVVIKKTERSRPTVIKSVEQLNAN